MDIGEQLRAARLQQGKSLRDVAQATKIGLPTLEALEHNDFSRLPGGLFARAFVRSCAQEVGLDPEPIVKAFVARCPDAAPETIADLAAEHRATHSPVLRWIAVAGVLAFLAAAVAGAFLWTASASTTPTPAGTPVTRGSQ